MIVLAVDSTAVCATAAACLFENDRLVTYALTTSKNGLTHSETLLPIADGVLRLLGKRMDEVGLFAVSAGPGSFTGVRIGAATLKGIAFGRNKPCCAVSALEALAYNLRAADGTVCALMDARRGQFYTECYAVYPYEGVVAESLRRFKFSGQSQYAASFGRMLAPLLRTAPFEILSWVPVSAKRRRSRGYDQTELLAHAVAKELELPCTQTLQKIRHNPAQSSQRDAAARRANVLGAYRAVSPERFAGRSVLLIDDILTTGATLSECSRVLLTAGASSVVCAALAATPEPGQKPADR